MGLLHLPQPARPGAAHELARVRARLHRLYAPVLPDVTVQSWWHELSGTALVVVTDRPWTSFRAGTWGARPLGHPLAGGPWVAWSCDSAAVEVRTSANAVATLRHVRHGGRSAWATRGLAAHVLAGSGPVVRPDVVPELVLLDCVVGDDDLLSGTERVPDGTVLRATAAGVTATRWVDDGRYAPGPPTTAASLRTAALGAARTGGAVHGAAVGLTAGLDSGLLAAALVATGHRPATLTMGWPGLHDVDGAQARASALGLPHRTVPLADAGGRVLDSWDALTEALRGPHDGPTLLAQVLRGTRWHEGNELPRNTLVGATGHADPAAWLLTGSGGELARALYWHDAPEQASPLDTLLRPRADHVAPAARRVLADRWAAELAAAGTRTGRSGTDTLDVFYLRSRMRNWLGNSLSLATFHGFAPAFLEPAMVTVLLDVPAALRRDGSLFRATTAALLAEAGVPASPTPAAPHAAPAASRRSSARAAAGRFARRRRNPPDPLSDWALLEPLLRHLDRHGPRLARDVLGEAWWSWAVRHAPARAYVRQWLWNAVAVDALVLLLDDL